MNPLAKVRAVLVAIVASAAMLASLLVIACSGAVKATGDGGPGGSSSGGGSSGGGSSGSVGGGSIVGEWQRSDDGGFTEEAFFDSDGTCGFIETYGSSFGTQSTCTANCTYSIQGDVLTLVAVDDGGASNAVSADFSVTASTLSFSPLDGGFSTLYTRVNSDSSNHCP